MPVDSRRLRSPIMTAYRRNVALLLCLLTATACASSRPWLNSERIEKRFGSYGVEVLHADEHRRVASLYSGSERTMRTYAFVEFLDESAEFRSEDRQIRAGASIGATFRAHGWTLRKDNLFIGELEVPPSYHEIGERMRIELPATLAVHQYLLVISRNGHSFIYARITEIHHPDYLTAVDLRRIYGEILFDDSNRDGIHDFIGPPT